jgi:hypothetical protein
MKVHYSTSLGHRPRLGGTLLRGFEIGRTEQDVWISGKPPSEEVIDLLLSYGISPDNEPEGQLEDPDDPPLSRGTGVMARQAEGARPAPPQHLCQVFTVGDAQVTEIRGYPDGASAVART